MSTDKQQQCVAIVGCGYVGAALGRTLAENGHDVIGTTTTPEREPTIRDWGLTPVVVKLAETERLGGLLRDRDAVYLTAAAGRRHGDYREVYHEGVKSLLRAVENTRVTRIIYTSSTAVYAQRDGGWVDETSPTEPDASNGRVLLEAERALLDGVKALRGAAPVVATVLRLSGVYGPRRDPHQWIERAAGKERTDGAGYLNLIHLDDIVAALVQLLEVPYSGVLNLSDDQPTRRREYYDRLLEAAGRPPIRWVDGGERPNLGKRIRNERIKRALGLALKHPTH